MMRVLVTGAAGFIGSRVARALLGRGYEVHGWVRSDPRPRLGDSGSELAIARDYDLRDTAEIASLFAELRPDLCIHCAWFATPGSI